MSWATLVTIHHHRRLGAASLGSTSTNASQSRHPNYLGANESGSMKWIGRSAHYPNRMLLVKPTAHIYDAHPRLGKLSSNSTCYRSVCCTTRRYWNLAVLHTGVVCPGKLASCHAVDSNAVPKVHPVFGDVILASYIGLPTLGSRERMADHHGWLSYPKFEVLLSSFEVSQRSARAQRVRLASTPTEHQAYYLRW